VAAVVSLTACSTVSPGGDASPSAEAPIRLAYASAGETLGFVATVTQSISDAADAAGYEINVQDNALDAAKSVTVARDVATTLPDVFLEYNGNADSNTQIARIMKDAGIPIVAIQYPIEGAPLFAIDNPLVGATGGKALADAAAKKWGADKPVQALVLTLASGGQIQQDRADGATGAIKKVLSNVEFTQGDTKNDANTARQVTADFLTAHPNDHIIIWTHVDSMGLAEVAAVKAAGREDDVLVVSTGGDAAIFDEIKSGSPSLIGTVGLYPKEWGPVIVDLAAKVARGEDVPAVTRPRDPALITRANLSEFE
jgi:ribose transport system substrate-binding protein